MAQIDPAVCEFKTVTLDIEQYQVGHIIEEWPFAERPSVDMHRENDIERLAIRKMLRMMQLVAVQNLPDIKYPADWFEALKLRFAPQWLLKRFPVEYTVWDVKVLYPDISLPERRHVVRVELAYLRRPLAPT